MISLSKNDKHCELYNQGAAAKELEFYSKILRENKDPIFFDVGANIGFFTKNLCMYCKQIHAFEPVSIVFDSLKENIKGINKIKANKFGLSDKNYNAEILLCSSHNQGHTLDERMTKKFKNFYGEKTEVIKLKTLENYCIENQVPYIDLLKIDCEGLEKNVILGLGDFVNNVKNIVFENYFEEDLKYILDHCCNHKIFPLNINEQPMYILIKK